MSGAYFNENDPFVAQWLRNLIAAGHLPAGEVDDRSILDVDVADLRGFNECHFFAGIGGWPLALRLAGWPADRLVWTASAPCQPFSTAGKGAAHEDRRHLWPAFFGLVRECRPAAIFGEQIASPLGRAWLDHVCADLESIGYAAAPFDLPACSIGAPHGRQRLYFVADASERGRAVERAPRLHADRESRHHIARRGAPRDAWQDVEWLACSDGKTRPTKPGLEPLAHGVPARVGRLRAYGNGLVIPLAAEFIGAYLELTG